MPEEELDPLKSNWQRGDAPPGPELQQRRENARRSLLRANTTVAVVIIAVLALALNATLASRRATRNQRKAEETEERARAELWRAYVADARAKRLGDTLARRPDALESIRRATAISPAAELRNEAIAALALADFALEHFWPRPEDYSTHVFDRELQMYAVGKTNGDVIVRQLNDNREVRTIRRSDGGIPADQGGAQSLEFSPDARRLAVRYQRGGFAIWDLSSGQALFRKETDRRFRSTSRPRFTSDGRFVIAPIFRPQEAMAVFETDTGKEVALLSEFDARRHAAPRPGTTTFAASDGTNIIVVNWQTRERVAEIPFAPGIRRLAWSPEGRLLAIGGDSLNIHIYDMETAQMRAFTGHKAEVWNLVFDRTGERLASSSFDGTSRTWDVASGRLIGVISEAYVEQFGEAGRVGLEQATQGFEVRRLAPSPVYRALVGPSLSADESRIMDLSPMAGGSRQS